MDNAPQASFRVTRISKRYRGQRKSQRDRSSQRSVKIIRVSLRQPLTQNAIASQSTEKHRVVSATKRLHQKIHPNTATQAAQNVSTSDQPTISNENDFHLPTINWTTSHHGEPLSSSVPSPLVTDSLNQSSVKRLLDTPSLFCAPGNQRREDIRQRGVSKQHQANQKNRITRVNDHLERQKRRRRCCCQCTPLRVFLSIMGAFFVAGLIAGIIAAAASQKSAERSTTTRTSTTSVTTTTPVVCSPPCLNGGTCVLPNYTCLCIPDVWEGPQCQTPVKILWTFDNNLLDFYGNFPGTGINNPGYRFPGINGYGSCLYLNGSRNQSVTVYKPPFLNMANTSFTLSAWVNADSLRSVSPSGTYCCDNAIFGQYDQNILRHALHIIVRYQRNFLGFYGDDTPGIQVLQTGVWYHMAYVYDYSTYTQFVYVNGVLDNFKGGSGPYQGTTGDLTIGTNGVCPGENYWDGCLDQITYFARAKNATEVLRDATLTVSYAFNNGTLLDDGPLDINGTGTNIQYTAAGRVNQSLQLSTTPAFVSATGLVYFGTGGNPYSITIWIRPNTVTSGTIVHASSSSSAVTWSMPMLGFTSAGNIAAQSCNNSGAVSLTGPAVSNGAWTHVAITYSSLNSYRLWINGTQFTASPSSFVWSTPGIPLTITLGFSPSSGGVCASGVITTGQYSGLLDEFQLYSRELTATDVMKLATP